jgi:Lipocalin-like domain
MLAARVLIAALIVAATPRASAQGIDPKALVGAWRLVSWETTQADGTVRKSPMSVGSLMYSDSGRMCGVLMDPTRKTPSRPPTDEEIRAAYNGIVAYCGTYEVDSKAGFVVHHVDLEKSPTNVGINRKRWFTLEGNRLSLKIDAAELPATQKESRLVWERVR